MIIPPVRGHDKWGDGRFGSRRFKMFQGGKKYYTHTGVDLCVWPGSQVMCLTYGVVTKIGHAYADDLSFRYVEVELDGNHFRYMYLSPLVEVGQKVAPFDILGTSQKLGDRYPGISEHVHIEHKSPSGEYLNPLDTILKPVDHDGR